MNAQEALAELRAFVNDSYPPDRDRARLIEAVAALASRLAPSGAGEVESALEFQKRIEFAFCRVDSPFGQAYHMVTAAIEARDAAVSQAAELRGARRVLSELCIWYAPELSLSPESFAAHTPRGWPGLIGAIAELNTKYGKEPA